MVTSSGYPNDSQAFAFGQSGGGFQMPWSVRGTAQVMLT